MVLCVSSITWSAPDLTDDGTPIEPHPELEVTDGWYRLRAQVDAPIARAVRRGIIRIGRKISVAGAKVCLPSSLNQADTTFPTSAILRKKRALGSFGSIQLKQTNYFRKFFSFSTLARKTWLQYRPLHRHTA